MILWGSPVESRLGWSMERQKSPSKLIDMEFHDFPSNMACKWPYI
jgi:hypothetical protein